MLQLTTYWYTKDSKIVLSVRWIRICLTIPITTSCEKQNSENWSHKFRIVWIASFKKKQKKKLKNKKQPELENHSCHISPDRFYVFLYKILNNLLYKSNRTVDFNNLNMRNTVTGRATLTVCPHQSSVHIRNISFLTISSSKWEWRWAKAPFSVNTDVGTEFTVNMAYFQTL